MRCALQAWLFDTHIQPLHDVRSEGMCFALYGFSMPMPEKSICLLLSVCVQEKFAGPGYASRRHTAASVVGKKSRGSAKPPTHFFSCLWIFGKSLAAW